MSCKWPLTSCLHLVFHWALFHWMNGMAFHLTVLPKCENFKLHVSVLHLLMNHFYSLHFTSFY